MNNRTGVCFKCNKTVQKKDFLRCIKCNKVFCADINCAQMPAKLFDIMTIEKKKSWTCRLCKIALNKNNKSTPNDKIPETTTEKPTDKRAQNVVKLSSPPLTSIISPESVNNITQRNYKPNVPVNNSFEQLTVDDEEGGSTINLPLNSTLLNSTMTSLPNLSAENLEVTELKKEIAKLQAELCKEREDFEYLYNENREIMKLTEKQKKTIQFLKHMLLTETNSVHWLIPLPNLKRRCHNHLGKTGLNRLF